MWSLYMVLNIFVSSAKVAIVELKKDSQSIQLDPRQIVKNPVLRALAKLMLNYFWGRCNCKLSTNSTCFS
jgi:hypothetical protein